MVNLLFCGDYYPCHRVADLIASGNGSDIFKDVRKYILDADFSIVNFEYPVVSNDERPIKKCGPSLKGTEASVPVLAESGFNVVTLANNHILDYGPEAMSNTQSVCRKYNLLTVGIGNDIEDSFKPLILEKDNKKIAIINCCEHEFSVATNNTAGACPLNPIKQYNTIQNVRKAVDYVIVVVHGGHEYYQLPSPRMQETYRFFVDVGADAVINHHQHCYSGYEVYSGKPIFYGLGNFCFDSTNRRNDIWNEGYMVSLHLDGDITFDVIPYMQCDVTPRVVLMNEQQANCFNAKIYELNDIIADKSDLSLHFAKLSESRCKDIEIAFSPWGNRVTQKLASMGLLPCLSKEKRLLMRALLQCEAHYDTLKYVFISQS